MNAVSEIARLVVPPSIVVTPERLQLRDSLAQPTLLPDDYVGFMTLFGTGCFGNDRFELHVFDLINNPSINEHTAFEVLYQFEYELEDQIIGSYPETSGLMPWGRDDQGTTFYWIAEGMPNSWTTVVGRLTHFKYAENMSQLLLRCIRDTIPFYDDERFGEGIKFYSASKTAG